MLCDTRRRLYNITSENSRDELEELLKINTKEFYIVSGEDKFEASKTLTARIDNNASI